MQSDVFVVSVNQRRSRDLDVDRVNEWGCVFPPSSLSSFDYFLRIYRFLAGVLDSFKQLLLLQGRYILVVWPPTLSVCLSVCLYTWSLSLLLHPFKRVPPT